MDDILIRHFEDIIGSELTAYGFECYPFNIRWYNDVVSERFKFQPPKFSGDNLALCIISTPHMFELAFLPYLNKLKEEFEHLRLTSPESDEFADLQVRLSRSDLLDQFVQGRLDSLAARLREIDAGLCGDSVSYKDSDLDPGSRRPRVLVQTAAAVSGAAYYYRSDELQDKDVWTEKDFGRVFGVCVHPLYGGWFAIRAVLIFKHINLPTTSPPINIPTTAPSTMGDDPTSARNMHWAKWSNLTSPTPPLVTDLLALDTPPSHDNLAGIRSCPYCENKLPLPVDSQGNGIISLNGLECGDASYSSSASLPCLCLWCTPLLHSTVTGSRIGRNSRLIELFTRFNFGNWRDWSFRDVIPPVCRYSPAQRVYFETKPADRLKMLGIHLDDFEEDEGVDKETFQTSQSSHY